VKLVNERHSVYLTSSTGQVANCGSNFGCLYEDEWHCTTSQRVIWPGRKLWRIQGGHPDEGFTNHLLVFVGIGPVV
jgi:hypothetical protein